MVLVRERAIAVTPLHIDLSPSRNGHAVLTAALGETRRAQNHLIMAHAPQRLTDMPVLPPSSAFPRQE